ncbi:cytochrome c biogenesis protein CcdA [Candidatus Parcubacteria bacterium]|nr:cytochrome c biogenesis protein CcdA [Candidatus Parcubacteria bacterium]
MELPLVLGAFVAGLLTFLAPCTLPLVPAYLGFISGVDQEALQNPATARAARWKIFFNGLAFIVGFSLIFVIFGTLAGLVGEALVPYRLWLARIGGVLIVLFGLFMLGVFKIPFLASEKRIPIFKWLSLGKPSTSFLIGGTFALGWTPCVGPLLGSILLLAGTSGTAIQGAVLLSVFSLGLSVPFLVIAFAFSRATEFIDASSKYLKGMSIVGGLFLIVLGLLLMTDNFGLTIQYGYQLLEFINYDRLLEFL